MTTSQEILDRYLAIKQSMFIRVDQQLSKLKPEFTRNQEIEVDRKIEAIKTAMKEKYAYSGSIADYLIQYVEKRGYSEYELQTRFKHFCLYQKDNRNDYIVIRDKTGKNFLKVIFGLDI
jgi:hypothetical protein